MRKIFNFTSWILLFTLAPFAVLIFLSQNSVPGDLFYPIKRGMEGIVLAAASASPATRVAFRTDLTERRFKEAERLLLAKADTSALDSFILEVQSTQTEVDALSNTLQKSQATDRLIAKIDDYQTKLVQLEIQTQGSSAPSVNQSPQTPQETIFQQQALPPSGAGQAGQSAVQQPKVTPLPQSTNPPPPAGGQPTAVVQNPPSQTAVIAPEQQRIVSETITTTKIELEKIKKDLEEKKREREERKPFDSAQDKKEKKEEKEKRPERNGKNPQKD
ncbi:hypothetical protein HYW66_00690 [Candidatus Microgenomates bacterium]|nr:hypothetical protein [Candidatus Microgenomates bacterium]